LPPADLILQLYPIILIARLIVGAFEDYFRDNDGALRYDLLLFLRSSDDAECGLDSRQTDRTLAPGVAGGAVMLAFIGECMGETVKDSVTGPLVNAVKKVILTIFRPATWPSPFRR
jgi:hypothetical protein